MTPAQRLGRAIVLAALLFNVALAGAWSVRAATLGAACGERTTAYSTSATTFAAVDTSALQHTITTNGGRVVVAFTGVGYGQNPVDEGIAVDVAVDGNRLGAGFGLAYVYNRATGENLAFTTMTGALGSGSHTFTLQARAIAGQGHITSNPPMRFCVHELPTDTAAAAASFDGTIVSYEGEALEQVERSTFVMGLGFVVLVLIGTAHLVVGGLRR